LNKTFCDICQKEISQFDRVYFLKYGEKSMNPLGKNVKGGQICNSCLKAIHDKVQEMRAAK